MTYTCANCLKHECSKKDKGSLPKNCSMNNKELMAKALHEYAKEENRRFYILSSEIEALGYGEWVRLKEIMEFSHMMGFKHLGLAFCRGLRHEAKIASDILTANGFEVSSVICKTAGVDKCEAHIAHKVHEGEFEPMCNPIAQAAFLEEAETEFNIVLGLCVGHDSLFYKYSHVLTTTFAVKDRVLAHNPLGAVYLSEGYMKKRVRSCEKT